MPPAKKVAILTCMDARLHPARILGLEPDDAHVIRNAGGRASDDAIRSLIISDLPLPHLYIKSLTHSFYTRIPFLGRARMTG